MSNLDFTDMDVEILYFMFDVPCFFYPNVIFFLLELGLFSHVFRPFGRPLHRSGRPNSGAQKTIFKFSFFSCVSTKKYDEVLISDFTMHLIISKWLIIQKCWQKRKTMKQRGRSKRRKCHRKCFHSFNYV